MRGMAKLLGFALLAAPLASQAVEIQVNENVKLNFGAWLKVWGGYIDKGSSAAVTQDSNNTETSTNINLIYPAWWFGGKVSDSMDFTLVWIAPGVVSGNDVLGTGLTLIDGFVDFNLADEFKITAGQFRAPFTRLHVTNEGTYVTETGPIYRGFAQGLSVSPAYRDKGVALWGNIAGGMLQYRLGVFDGRYNMGECVDLNSNGQCDSNEKYTKDNLAYVVRVQFTPTMAGFDPEEGWVFNETYLGKKNILTVGASFASQKWERNDASDTATMWDVDVNYEQKFGTIVPNLGGGYIETRKFDNQNDTKYLYANAQLLYDMRVGPGKPAIGLRFEREKPKGASSTNRYQVWLNYYLKGHSAKVMAGVDNLKPGGGSSATNVQVAAQVIF